MYEDEEIIKEGSSNTVRNAISTPMESMIRQNFHRRRAMPSVIWKKFTVVSRQAQIAVCNVCGKRLSYKSSVSNLHKHMKRKHFYDIYKNTILKRKKESYPDDDDYSVKPTLTEMTGLTVNVVGDNGEMEQYQVIDDHEVSREELGLANLKEDNCQEDSSTLKNQRNHNNDIEIEVLGSHSPTFEAILSPRIDQVMSVKKVPQPEHASQEQGPYRQKVSKRNQDSEKNRQSRILDLQLECLEIKKYNMQLEALLMEQQLNLRRSVFTQNLRCADVYTRSTQTDFGGSETKVFYVSERRGGRPVKQMFTFQGIDSE